MRFCEYAHTCEPLDNWGWVGSKVCTKDAHWLWIIAAEPDLLPLSKVPRGGPDILGAGDIQKSGKIVLCISRYLLCEFICGLSGVHSGCSNVFPFIQNTQGRVRHLKDGFKCVLKQSSSRISRESTWFLPHSLSVQQKSDLCTAVVAFAPFDAGLAAEELQGLVSGDHQSLCLAVLTISYLGCALKAHPGISRSRPGSWRHENPTPQL